MFDKLLTVKEIIIFIIFFIRMALLLLFISIV